jgi:predicted Zn-dependent protease
VSIFTSLQRHPWRVVAGLATILVFGACGYALFFYYHLHAAEEANARYDFDDAQEHLATCIRLWPRRAELHFLAARTARRAGRFAEAMEHLDAFERLEGKTPGYLLEYAMLRAQQGDFESSGPYLIDLLEKDHPDSTLILEALAQGTNHVYHLGKSIHFAEGALQREPGNVPMLLLHAHLWDSVNRFDDAEKDYRAAIEAQPGHAQARLELAQFLIRHDKADEAEDHFEQLRKRHYRVPAVLMGLALCRRHQGRTAEEREFLDALLAESPDDPNALAERGKLELEADELDAAERDLRNVLSQVPYESHTTLYLAQCLQRQGRDEESAVYVAKAAQLEGDMKRLEELVREIAKDANNAEKLRQAGVICLRIGLDQEAERWFLGAWHADPRHKPTNQSLADLYTRRGRPDLAAPFRDAAR